VPLIASIIRYERRIKELEAMVAALEGHHGDVSLRESVVLGDVSPAQHTTAAGPRTVLPSRRLELLPSPEPPSLD
jgi:hypothetical protein